MAAVAAPKICMEREKKKEEKRGKKEKKGGKKELGGEESKRERCIRLMGVKMKMRMRESDEKTLVLLVWIQLKTPPQNYQKIMKDTKRGQKS